MVKPEDYNHKLKELFLEQWFPGDNVVKFGSLDDLTDLPLKTKRSGDWEISLYLRPRGICMAYDPHLGTHYITETSNWFEVLELYQGGVEVMTSDVREHDSYRIPSELASGRVLMVGLGLGLLPSLVWDKLGREITQLDIVESEQDVIDLVGGYINHPVVTVTRGDAWDYPKLCRETYDFIFLDIWSGNAEAVALGPGLMDSYRNLLKSDGVVRFWLQEIYEHLTRNRGNGFDKTHEPCRICGGGWFMGHSNLYGGLCLECASDYEGYLHGDSETHANAELTRTLQSLGYKTLKPKVSDIDIADLVVETLEKKYLVECKKDLVDSDMLKKLREKVVSYSLLKDQYDGLKLVMHGNTNLEMVLKLGQFIEHQGLSDWIEILGSGDVIA